MREQKLLCQLSNFYLRHLWSSLLALWAHKESGCLILPAHLFNNGCRAGITCCWYGGEMYQFSATTVLALMIGFYLLTFLMTLLIREKKENVDGYMVSNGSVGFGVSAASMTGPGSGRHPFMQQPVPDIPMAFPAPCITGSGEP